MGHGSYLQFAIFAAPASIVPGVGFFMAPVWWGMVGYALSSHRSTAAAVMMVLHLLSVGLALWFGSPMEPGSEQWRYFSRASESLPFWIVGGFAVYIIGQIAALVRTVETLRS